MTYQAEVRRHPEEEHGLVIRNSPAELAAALRIYAKRYPVSAMTWMGKDDDPLNTPEMSKYLDYLETLPTH